MRRCSLVVASVLISVAALTGCGSDADESTDSSGAETSAPSSDGSGSADGDDGGSGGSPESGGDTSDGGEPPGDGDQGQDSGAEDDANERNNDDGQGDEDDGEKDDKAGKKTSGNAAYCKLARTLRRELNPSNESAFVDADFQAISTRLGRIADSAPGGVASDWRKLSNGFGTLAKRFDALGVDLDKPKTFTTLKPKQQKQLRSAITQVSSLQGSIKAAVASARKTCGISVR